MKTAYPSNLTPAQYELLSGLIPPPKPGGRPRSVDIEAVVNAIFYVLVEGVRWRSLPSDVPAWSTVYRYLPMTSSRSKTIGQPEASNSGAAGQAWAIGALC
jgi:transposase